MKSFKLNKLYSLMVIVPAIMMPTSTTIYASDLTIYKGGTTGTTSIFLMLDTSGSMGISSVVMPKTNAWGSPGDVSESLCERKEVNEGSSIWEWAYNLKGVDGKTTIKKTVVIDNVPVPYYVRGCTKTVNGQINTQYDRLSRLKDAILPLLADRDRKTGIDDKVIMGLGQYSSKTDLNIGNSGNKLTDSHSGRVLVANAALNGAQRLKLATAIANIKSVDTLTNEDGTPNNSLRLSSTSYPNISKISSGTPTAHAYAEAAAYMMGTGTGYSSTQNSLTKVNYIYDGYMVKQYKGTDDQVYFICAKLGPGRVNNALGNVKQCPSSWPKYDKTNLTITDASPVYKRDGVTRVTPAQLKAQVGGMNSTWDIYKKLPVGWFLDGWRKVDNEPMDIETMGGVVYNYNNTKKDGTNEGDVIRGLVAYRTNPFSLIEAEFSATDNFIGGMRYSVSDSRINDSTYKRGGTTNECDGNGIYFLTDGAPNSTKVDMAQTIMNTSLTNTFAFSGKPSDPGVLASPPLQSNLFAGETGGWEFIGEYAKKIINRAENPSKMQIKTAVVGFGASFEGLTKNADGTYDCDSTSNLDVKNACKWGSKGAGYGEGGFYQATSSAEIAESIIQFVEDLKVPFTSTSLGTISIPIDPLDQTKVMSTGFFPMIQPLLDNSKRTWLGNLKKYYVLNGTLSDSETGGNLLYKVVGKNQIVNPNAKDIWSNETGDNSLIKVGGAWNKIPVPANFISGQNPINNVDSTRNVFVVSGGSLKKVTRTNLATEITQADQIGTKVQFPIKNRIALLNYLGYAKPLPDPMPLTLTTNVISSLPAPTSPYRYLGGVVHSTPFVVTKEASINSDNKVTSREEYVIYGSMDGGLHTVNANTGEEKSVFVPDEVLANQPETLINENFAVTGTVGASALVYGVDAPWVADNTFKVEASGSATKYIARTMNIYGGLRMGGSALYGLDISTPTAPSLKFKIAPTTSGFSRLGQIWSKPVVASIRVKGIVEKVLIFGGGYDKTVFEDGVETVSPSGPTIGNALYIVKASNGELLWSVSSSNTASVNTPIQADVKFSVVGQPAVRDYNADGLTDVIYFADLGGQIFRVDLNNAAQASRESTVGIAVRTQTLAQLKTNTFTPRFYERPSTAVFKEGQNRFVLITLGSGNRSYPLVQESGLNKVYGIIDYDATAKNLESPTFSPSVAVLPVDLITTGVLGKTVSAPSIVNVANTTADVTALQNRTKKGWAFSLKGLSGDGFVKAMEETQLVNSDLYVSVYDPKAVLGGGVASNCGSGIQGLSTVNRICMPYGNCAAYATTDNQGIIGIPLGPVNSDNSRKTQIVSPTAITAEKCVGEGCGVKDSEGNNKPFIYKQSRVIKPIRWYEW